MFCLSIYLFIFKTTFLLQTIFDFNDRRTRVCKDTFQKWSMDWNSFIKLRITMANTNIQVKMIWKVSTKIKKSFNSNFINTLDSHTFFYFPIILTMSCKIISNRLATINHPNYIKYVLQCTLFSINMSCLFNILPCFSFLYIYNQSISIKNTGMYNTF